MIIANLGKHPRSSYYGLFLDLLWVNQSVMCCAISGAGSELEKKNLSVAGLWQPLNFHPMLNPSVGWMVSGNRVLLKWLPCRLVSTSSGLWALHIHYIQYRDKRSWSLILKIRDKRSWSLIPKIWYKRSCSLILKIRDKRSWSLIPEIRDKRTWSLILKIRDKSSWSLILKIRDKRYCTYTPSNIGIRGPGV